MRTPIDTTPAPAMKPLPSFNGSMADRLGRSSVVAKMAQQQTHNRMLDSHGTVWPSWESLAMHILTTSK